MIKFRCIQILIILLISNVLGANDYEKLNLAANMFTQDELVGKIRPSKDSTFINIPSNYATHAYMYMRKEAFDSYERMYEAALKDGIELRIISATRTYYQQKRIWENKWDNLSHLSPESRADKILQYSSIPGISRHHWGTDIDFISVSNSYWMNAGVRVYEWLSENAHKYGYCQPYTDDENREGFNSEPWHWSYKPIAKFFHKQYMLASPLKLISDFKGSDVVVKEALIEEYVDGISDELKM